MQHIVYLVLCCLVSWCLCSLTPPTDSLTHITEILNNLTKIIDVLENENKNLKQQMSVSNVHPRVSFTVQADSTDITQLGVNQVIVFKKLISQEGNSYDTRTGIFRCSVSGTYLFTASIMNNAPNVETTVAFLSKNGANSIPIHCSNSNHYYNMCSATLITHLVVGDEIWVKHNSGGETDNYSSFAGVLIQPN